MPAKIGREWNGRSRVGFFEGHCVVELPWHQIKDFSVEADSEDSVYAETNHKIIEEAQSLGNDLEHRVNTVRVWEGKSRGAGDLTQEFGTDAEKKGIPVVDVMTF